jgi:hypothetical protein
MATGFEMIFDGLAELSQVFERLERFPLPAETELPRREFGEYMQLRKEEYFAAGTAPDGTPWPASARAMGFGGQTMQNSGKLKASINYDLDGPDFVWFSDDIRADVHQEGKTIYPKPGHRALAIPLSKEAAESYQAGVSIREQWPNAFLLHSEGGNAFIVQKTDSPIGGSLLGSLEFLFLLVPKVTLPQRVIVDLAERDLDEVEQIFVRHLISLEGGNA